MNGQNPVQQKKIPVLPQLTKLKTRNVILNP